MVEEGVARRSSLSMGSLQMRSFGTAAASALSPNLPLIQVPICSIEVSAGFTEGDSRPSASTQSRSLIVKSSSSSSEITRIATPWSRRSISACRINCAAPTSTPQVGCATIIILGCSMVSRPTMNFCRLPPDRLEATDCSPPHLTLKRSMTFLEKVFITEGWIMPFCTMPLRAPVSSAL